VLRDDQGNTTDHPGLRLRLSDFAYEELVQKELGDQNREIHISGQQLCQFLAAAESKVQRAGSLGIHLVAPGVKKRKRSATPPDEIASGDEARYVEQEERVRIMRIHNEKQLVSPRIQVSIPKSSFCTSLPPVFLLEFLEVVPI